MKNAISKRLSWVVLGMVGWCVGCSGFFLDNKKPVVPPVTPPVAAGDYAYVANNTTGTLSGFSLGAGTLALVAGSPYTLATGLAPLSVAVTRQNTFVYVGGNGGIVCYTIGAGGALTATSAGGATATANFVSLETSPDGNWVFALDGLTSVVYVYQINLTTGLLAPLPPVSFGAPGKGAVTPRMIRSAANGTLVGVALGPAGDVIFSFNATTGALTPIANLAIAAGFSDNAIAFDPTSAYTFVARGGPLKGTSGVASYSVGATGALTPVQTLAASGNVPFSLVLDSTGTYLYAANRADATISSYSVAAGKMTALAGTALASGQAVTALAADNSKKYVLAVALGGAADVTMYGFDAVTAGKLGPVATAASGPQPAGAIAIATTY